VYVTVDWDRCTGIGLCESLDPERFEIADDGTLKVLRDGVTDAERTQVEEAVRLCPTGALKLAASPA
jgi:ferredoxin